MKTVALLALAILSGGALATEAEAYWGYGWGGGYGRCYGIDAVPAPPYFAVHPPVYYSHVQPRAYGWSPYAYPGYTASPAARRPRPAVIINRHVPQTKKDTDEAVASRSTVRVKPLLVINPYVRQDSANVAVAQRP